MGCDRNQPLSGLPGGRSKYHAAHHAAATTRTIVKFGDDLDVAIAGTCGRLCYTRSFEVKELSVPANKAQRLKDMYRIIESDGRNSVVLRRASP
jgi:hypothetical protein